MIIVLPFTSLHLEQGGYDPDMCYPTVGAQQKILSSLHEEFTISSET